MNDAARQVVWSDDENFTVGDLRFRSAVVGRFESTPDLYCIVKPRELVEAHIELLETHKPKRIVELGIAKGGSTALVASLTDPEKLVAVDIIPDRLPGLDHFIDSHGYAGRVEAHYQVDQGNKAQLDAILDVAFGDGPLDMVLDDASHLVDLTRASFEILFPLIKPGGLYVIEDWAWAHVPFSAGLPEETPLSLFVLELMCALAFRPGLIAGITVDRHWAIIERGDLPLDRDTFKVADHHGKRSKAMLAKMDGAVPATP